DLPYQPQLLQAQQTINDPAPARMGLFRATVSKDGLVIAPGFLQRIGENRHPVERMILVHLASDGSDCLSLANEPVHLELDRRKRIAQNIAHHVRRFALAEVLIRRAAIKAAEDSDRMPPSGARPGMLRPHAKPCDHCRPESPGICTAGFES